MWSFVHASTWWSARTGSGKSSLLEAVHILGSGRSFRSHRLRDVVTRGESTLRIVGRTVGSDGTSETTGIEHKSDGLRIRRAGVDVKAASELAAYLPTVTLTPDSHRLITDGADLRRRIVDRLLFHVEPTYLKHHRRYRRALRQRNAAIRDSTGAGDLDGWDVELAQAGELLTEQRVRYLHRALQTMRDVVGALVGKPVDIQFYRGWDSDLSLAQACKCSLADDRMRGHTQADPIGPTFGSRSAVDLCGTRCRAVRRSSSSQRSRFAQVLDLTTELGHPPVVLVDDIASELDSDSRGRCMAQLTATGAQLFLTAVPNVGMEMNDVEAERLFHVERGHIHQVI